MIISIDFSLTCLVGFNKKVLFYLAVSGVLLPHLLQLLVQVRNRPVRLVDLLQPEV